MHDSQNASLKKNVALNSAASVFYLFCTWLTTVFVVVLSANFEASGILSVAMSVGNVFATIMLFKVRPVQTSDINNEYSEGHYIAFRIITFGLASIFCIIYCTFTVESYMLSSVLAYLIFKAGESFTDVLHGIYQRENRFDLIAISQICRGLLTIIPFCATLVITQNLLAALIIMAIATIAYTVIVDLRLTSKLASVRPHADKHALKSLAKRCLPGFLGLLFCTLTVSLVRQEYAIAYGSELMGIYAAIAAPAVIVQAAATFIYTPLFGPIACAIVEGDQRTLKTVIVKFAIILVALLAICMIAFYLLGEPVFCAIYGTTIRDYLYIMYALLICTAVTAFVNFLLDYLIILKSRFLCVAVNLIGMIIAAALWQPLCSTFGMNGINFAITIGYAINAIIALICILLKIKQQGTVKRCK